MACFYELIPDEFWHLKEYHEYFFWSFNKPRFPEIQRLEEYEHFDIRLFPFEGSEQLRMDAEKTKHRISLPEPLYFTGNFETVENTDYPVIDNYQLPVISKKLLSVLESVKPFAYRAIPVTIFDFLANDPFLPGGAFRDGVKRTTDYVYLQFFQAIVIEKSRSCSGICPDFEIDLPEEELDPIFRVRQLPQRLFITREARRAIDQFNRGTKDEECRLKGFRLWPSWTGGYIDYWGETYHEDYGEEED
jgi:hypothetical protein